MKAWNVFVIAVLLTGCHRETEEIIKEVEVEKKPAWSQRKWFIEGVSHIKLNTHVTEENLFLYGPNFMNNINLDGSVSGGYLFMRYPAFYKLPIADDWFVETDENFIRFNSNLNPASEGAKIVDVKGLDPDYTSVYLSSYVVKQIDVNDVNECLVPIIKAETGVEFYRFKIGVGELSMVSILDTMKIDLPEKVGPQAVFGEKDYFIVSFSDPSDDSRDVYKIYPDGSNKKISDQYFHNIFRISNNRLLATGTNYPSRIHFSEDDGETWTTYADADIHLVMMDYKMVGDSIVGFSWSNLYSVKYTNNSYSIRVLENDGLENTEITSVAAFNDSVFVTTYAGVYVRSKADFFQSKEAKE